MKHVPDWPIAFFDDDYLRLYRPTFTEERTRAEVDFIESVLEPAGRAMLDLACGIGRHAVELASRGHAVTGLDFNPRYLEEAARAAAARRVAVRWREGDMRALPFEREFAGIYSFFTSFGYFSDEENERVVAEVAKALVPGGKFLIDLANRDWILTHPRHRTWTQLEDGTLLMEETWLELATSKAHSRQVLMEAAHARVTKEHALRAYTCAEITRLFERHGLMVERVWGDLDGGDYSIESRRLVALARLEPGRR